MDPLGGGMDNNVVLFGKNVCKNKRIGFHRGGGHVPGTPPLDPPMTTLNLVTIFDQDSIETKSDTSQTLKKTQACPYVENVNSTYAYIPLSIQRGIIHTKWQQQLSRANAHHLPLDWLRDTMKRQ